MKKTITLFICMLIIFTPLNVLSFSEQDRDLGEVITVSVDNYEPTTLSSDYLQAKNFPVYVFLRGFTIGSILFGEDAPETAPFFGGLKLKKMNIIPRQGSAQYISGSIKKVLPKDNYLEINSNGEIDLGYLVLNLKQIKEEQKLPDEIELNMTARFYFDSHPKFSIFGAQDLLLEPSPNKQTWLSNKDGAFWSNKGYVRLIEIDSNKAKFEVYDGSLKSIKNFELRKNQEETMKLSGGVSFLDDLVTVKLKELLVPESIAKLSILEENGIISEQIAVEGMSPFIGSNWVVEKIYEDKIIFEDKDGNELFLDLKKDTEKSEPCEENIDESTVKDLTKKQALCLAIEYYKEAISHSQDISQKNEIYYNLAKAHEGLKQYLLAVQNYKKITSSNDKYNAIQNTIKVLEEKIDQNLNSITLDRSTIFLEDIEFVEDKDPYFKAKIVSKQEEITGEWEDTTDKNAVKEYIKSMAYKYEIPIDLALAVAEQESNFDQSAGSVSGCKGVMQICSWQMCESELEINSLNDLVGISNTDKNIECGMIILKKKYSIINSEKQYRCERYVFDGGHIEEFIDKSYGEWDAALRYYNGWACAGKRSDGTEIFADHYYVENVNNKKQKYSEEEYTSYNKKYELRNYLKIDSENWDILSINKDKVIIESNDKQKELRLGINNIGNVMLNITEIKSSQKKVIVTILPGQSKSFASSDFTIHLPIEKSLIQWTPEEIDKKINRTRKTIEKLENILDTFGNVIKGWKITCFSVYTFLTIKNAFFTKNPLARKKVVEKFTETCKKEIELDPTKSIDDCLLEKNDEIEEMIGRTDVAINEIKKYKKDFNCDKDVSKYLDNKLDEEYLQSLCELEVIKTDDIDSLIFDKHLDLDKFDGQIGNLQNKEEDYKNAIITAKDQGIINEKGEIKDRAKLNILLGSINSEERNVIPLENGYSGTVKEINYLNENKEGFYKGNIITNLEDQNQNLEDGSKLYKSGNDYYAVLNIGGPEYAKGYNGPSVIQYNEKNQPWIFPLEIKSSEYKIGTENGKYDIQYIYVDHSKGSPNFQALNVGTDGKIDLMNHDTVIDDKTILSPEEITKNSILNGKIKQAYDKFNKQHTQGDTISFKGEKYTASFLKSKISKISAQQSCLYIMPAKDCKILFNVCDPVMCPSSRFDLNGKWPVDNVISTGIIGSLVLGLGNGDLFPVCLSGVHAGLDNIKIGFEGYEDCLQKAKVEGKSVGICNEIRSLYVCEMLWREALAMSGVIGKFTNLLTEKLIIKNINDGGEYSKWEQSWDSLGDSVNFFTKEYATSSFSAFTARSSEEFGTDLCKAAIFGKVPAGGDFISQLTEPTSPPQFTAWINELEYGSIEQGKSLYRIYYHIYAGRDKDIIYNVYMRNNQGTIRSLNHESSFYSGPRKLNAGDYVDQSMRIAETPGFNEICIQIDGASPKCGFGKVTSAFSLDYMNDLLVKSELNREINNANDCVPEYPRTVPAMGSLPTPQTYGLIETGIIRKCYINDPDGVGDKWVEVGNCGTDEKGISLGTCFMDTSSYNVYNEVLENDITEGLKEDEINRLKEEGYYEESEALIVIEKIEKNMGDINNFVKDALKEKEEKPTKVLEETIDELKKIIEQSIEEKPKLKGHELIAKLYHAVANEITDEDPLLEKDFPCEIEYEEDSKSGISNLVFKFENGNWLWKNFADEKNINYPNPSISHSPDNSEEGYLKLDQGNKNDLKDIYGNLLSSLSNLHSIDKNKLREGIDILIKYSNYDQEKIKSNDDHLIIIDQSGNKKELDWKKYYFISQDDVLTACDGEKREYNCIIETNEGGALFNIGDTNWLFRFNKERGTWEIKTKNNYEEFNLWKPLNKDNLEKLEDLISSNMFSLSKKLKNSDFEEGVKEFINFQKEENKIYVIRKGEKVYEPKTGEANQLEIYGACNIRFEGEIEELEEQANEQSVCKIKYTDGNLFTKNYWFSYFNGEWTYNKIDPIWGVKYDPIFGFKKAEHKKVSTFITNDEEVPRGVYYLLLHKLAESVNNNEFGIDSIIDIMDRNNEKITTYLNDNKIETYSSEDNPTKEIIMRDCNQLLQKTYLLE
jgi:hypothetical protein